MYHRRMWVLAVATARRWDCALKATPITSAWTSLILTVLDRALSAFIRGPSSWTELISVKQLMECLNVVAVAFAGQHGLRLTKHSRRWPSYSRGNSHGSGRSGERDHSCHRNQDLEAAVQPPLFAGECSAVACFSRAASNSAF